MRIRPLLAAAAAATLTLAACGESSTTPQRLSPTEASRDEELTCRSGYHIATREDGTQYCAPDDEIRRTGARTAKP